MKKRGTRKRKLMKDGNENGKEVCLLKDVEPT